MMDEPEGLSPRVRGNRLPIPGPDVERRSIPASAGEPRRKRKPQARRRVYPRECGGTGDLPVAAVVVQGLSPRVRGNPGWASQSRNRWRSIPASAGEPRPGHREENPRQVYPRECGGTSARDRAHWEKEGLSPRVRGNLAQGSLTPLQIRSIPASAGEPRGTCPSGIPAAVYPRECGGTSIIGRETSPMRGLSPRVRGNRARCQRCSRRWGSIPASAGEPGARSKRRCSSTVYPRECGGTSCCLPLEIRYEGLSPRVRGNHAISTPYVRGQRSIPASAGEPASNGSTSTAKWVYPRECGGT